MLAGADGRRLPDHHHHRHRDAGRPPSTAAQRKTKGSELAGAAGEPDGRRGLRSTPRTAGCVAYYGGDNGTGTDYAGKNTDSNGAISGGHSPGSSFKIYTLAAALKAGKSIESRWKGKAFTPEGTKFKVSNAGTDNPSCGNSCTLRGVDAEVAERAVLLRHPGHRPGQGRRHGQAGRRHHDVADRHQPAPRRYDLTKDDPRTWPRIRSSHVVGYGQYPITVLDHANGVATFANEGVYNKAHFVYAGREAGPGHRQVGQARRRDSSSRQQRIDADVVADVTVGAEEVPGRGSTTSWRTAARPPPRPAPGNSRAAATENGDAWMVGYTPQLATAVWVGQREGPEADQADKDGNKISGAGDARSTIWERFMNDALKGEDEARLPAPPRTSATRTPATAKPPPPPPPRRPASRVCRPAAAALRPGGSNPCGNRVPMATPAAAIPGGNPAAPGGPTGKRRKRRRAAARPTTDHPGLRPTDAHAAARPRRTWVRPAAAFP